MFTPDPVTLIPGLFIPSHCHPDACGDPPRASLEIQIISTVAATGQASARWRPLPCRTWTALASPGLFDSVTTSPFELRRPPDPPPFRSTRDTPSLSSCFGRILWLRRPQTAAAPTSPTASSQAPPIAAPDPTRAHTAPRVQPLFNRARSLSQPARRHIS